VYLVKNISDAFPSSGFIWLHKKGRSKEMRLDSVGKNIKEFYYLDLI
jgi:hypothetical protein